MPKYPLIQCDVNLAGSTLHVVPKRGDDRVTPAELLLIKREHSSENVDTEVITNAMWTGDIEMDEGELREVLERKYGGGAVRLLFPGPLPTSTDAPDKREWYEARLRGEDIEPGLDPADAPQEPESGTKAALQKSYTLLTGKKPFGGWNEDQLRQQIAKATAPAETEAA